MAALLYQGDLINARHLWRRCSSSGDTDATIMTMTNPLLADWWKVGQAMMEWDATTLWPALQHIEISHPTPINHYAKSVATAFRLRLLRRIVDCDQYFPIKALPMAPFLNFTSTVELQDFCQQYGYDLMENNYGINIVQRKKQQQGAESSTTTSSSSINGIMTTCNGMVDPHSSIVQIVTCLESSIVASAFPEPSASGSCTGGASTTVALATAVATKH
jgi:hypothetical protein